MDTLLARGTWTVDNNRQPVMYSGGTKNVYRLNNEGIHRHLLTTDENEYKILSVRGWRPEGGAFTGIF